MDWANQVSTLIGAVVGVGSTLLVDRSRGARDRHQRLNTTRRDAYAAYLTALTQTDAGLQLLAVSEVPPVSRTQAMSAWQAYSVLARRYDVVLVAPDHIAKAASSTFDRLLDIRDAITTTAMTVGEPGSPAWEAVHLPYIAAIVELRSLMRDDVRGG